MKYISNNGVALCVVNIFFFFFGTFLNVVVALSIWKSSQLRKKLCYFMIFVLSCSDLLVVLVLHPLLIYWYTIWYLDDLSVFSERFQVFFYIGSTLYGFSMIGLLTMTLERYLGLVYPIFHKTSVTKKRLAVFLVATQGFAFLFETVAFTFEIFAITKPYTLVFIAVFAFVVIAMNYKMFCIAKSRNKITSPTPIRNRPTLEYKKYYTCVLLAVWFLVSYCPTIIYYALTLLDNLAFNSEMAVSLFFWSSTVVTMNATINSLIFFWMNNVLRNEGWRLLKDICP